VSTQEMIPGSLFKPNVHYYVHKSPKFIVSDESSSRTNSLLLEDLFLSFPPIYV